MMKFFTNRIVQIAIIVSIPLAVYFINVEVQSYWGNQAIQATGLRKLSLNDALATAKTEDKLVIVDVAAVWCTTCRKLDNQVFANAEVRKEINDNFVFSRLEYESEEGMAFLEKYKAAGFPNLWVLDSDGNVVRKLNVVFTPDAFLSQLPN